MHPIHAALANIANLRKNSVALQRGLQLNLELAEDSAAFFRVYQRDGEHQTALVLLNKSDTENVVDASTWLFDADWRDAISGASFHGSSIDVPAHGVRVLTTSDVFGNEKYAARLNELQALATAGSAHH
jgi:cyclomaltodextrin glucanotransferase